MPAAGAKKRDTKSKPSVLARLVTITPRVATFRNAVKSGASERSSASDPTSTR